jgi:hypothetical protein
VTLDAAALDTVTGSVIAAEVAPGANAVVLVHVTVCAAVVQLQPVPVAEDGVKPVGRVSVTVIVPVVVDDPALFTCIVYASLKPTPKVEV